MNDNLKITLIIFLLILLIIGFIHIRNTGYLFTSQRICKDLGYETGLVSNNNENIICYDEKGKKEYQCEGCSMWRENVWVESPQ